MTEDPRVQEEVVDPEEVKQAWQEEMNQAFEDVVTDLENVRGNLCEKIDEIAQAAKSKLATK